MNEKPLLTKMRNEYKYFGGLSILYGLIFAFCLYKNMYGITFPLCVLITIGTAVLLLKKINYKIQKQSLPYVVGMVLLGISTALTTSTFFHFFNLLGIILLFFVFMIHQFYNDSIWDFPGYLKRIFILLGTIIGSVHYPYIHGSKYMASGKNEKKYTLLAVIIGFCSAIGVLCIVLPLLLKSDLVFAKIFGELLKYINFATIFGICFMIILGFTCCYAFFAALCRYNFPEGRGRKLKYYNPIIGITFSSIISFIYLIYCLIQILYLFIGVHTGLPADVTYAEYARGGFWELLFVSFINFLMVLLCMYIFSENLILKVILTTISGCTFIMIFSAFYRMIMYIGAYHLTFLRILVLWFLTVLTLIMAGVIISIYKKAFPLFHYIVAIVSILYIGFSFSHPDKIIVRYNISHAECIDMTDIFFFIHRTSLDAAPEIASIDLDSLVSDQESKEYMEESMYNYFYNISTENEGIYFRKANYSRIRAKLAADKYLEEHEGYVKER